MPRRGLILCSLALGCVAGFSPARRPLPRDGRLRATAPLGREIADIAAPALASLAVEPLASLVDVAIVGRVLGTRSLAATSAACAVVGLVSRCGNFVLAATTTRVAIVAANNATSASRPSARIP